MDKDVIKPEDIEIAKRLDNMIEDIKIVLQVVELVRYLVTGKNPQSEEREKDHA